MKHRAVLPMQIAKYGTILVSVLYFILALVCVLDFTISMTSIEKILGSLFLMFGMIKLIGYFSKDLFRLAFQYDCPFGIYLITLGLFVLLKAPIPFQWVSWSYGISRILDCLCKIKITKDAKCFGIEKWWIILVLAILSGISGLAFMVLYQQELALLLLSITLILEGILNISVMISMVKIIHYQQPDELKER